MISISIGKIFLTLDNFSIFMLKKWWLVFKLLSKRGHGSASITVMPIYGNLQLQQFLFFAL
jgi:hypothetical protein